MIAPYSVPPPPEDALPDRVLEQMDQEIWWRIDAGLMEPDWAEELAEDVLEWERTART